MERKNVNVIIERASDGRFSCYMDCHDFNFALCGYGDTAEDAKQDFLEAYEEVKEFEDVNLKVELEFEFKYDVASFLQYYKSKLSLSGLELITGVNQRQLSQYLNGTRNASPKTTAKIEKAVHAFSEELSRVSFS